MNSSLIRTVAIGIMTLAGIAVLGIIVLASLERPIPDALAGVPVAAVPGLLGLLVRSSDPIDRA